MCHHINGSCTRGGCETGWEGRNCSVGRDGKKRNMRRFKNARGIIFCISADLISNRKSELLTTTEAFF